MPYGLCSKQKRQFEVNLNKYYVKNLREVLAKIGQPLSGTKLVLVGRLVAFIEVLFQKKSREEYYHLAKFFDENFKCTFTDYFPDFDQLRASYAPPFDNAGQADYQYEANIYPDTPFHIIGLVAEVFVETERITPNSENPTTPMNISLDLDMAERFNLLGLKKDEFKGIHIYLLSRTVSDKRSIVFPPDFGFYLGTSALLRVFPKEPYMLSSLRYLAPNEETVWHQKAKLDLNYLPVSNERFVFQVVAGRAKTAQEFLSSISMESREKTLALIETKLKGDDGLETTSVSLSLRCPLNLSRIVRPMKGKACNHIQCFEGHSVFALVGNRTDSKFACPICSEMLRIPMDLVCDTYFMELLNSVPSHCNSITLKPNGEWCPDIVDEDIQRNCVIDLTGCVDDPDEELPERWKKIVVKREKDLDRSVSNLLSDLMSYKNDKGPMYPNIVPKSSGAPPSRAASNEIVIVSSEDEEYEDEVEVEENDGEVEEDETDNNSENDSYDYSDNENQIGSLHDRNFTGNPGLLRTIDFQDKDFLSALEQTLLFASRNNETGLHYEDRETNNKRSRVVQPRFMDDNRGYYPIRLPTKTLIATKHYNNHNINHREVLGHSTNNRQAFSHYSFNKPSNDHSTDKAGTGTVASPIVID